MNQEKLNRHTRGMPIPKSTVKQIEKGMSVSDALKILGKSETNA